MNELQGLSQTASVLVAKISFTLPIFAFPTCTLFFGLKFEILWIGFYSVSMLPIFISIF